MKKRLLILGLACALLFNVGCNESSGKPSESTADSVGIENSSGTEIAIGGSCESSVHAFGAWKKQSGDYYGCMVEFYINPEKPKDSVSSDSQFGVYGAYGRHVMDNMVKLLRSESFAEQMLLNGKAVPDNSGESIGVDKWTSTEKEKNKLDGLIAAANTELDKVSAEQDVLNTKLEDKSELVKSYNAENDKLTAEWKKLYDNGQIETAYPNFTQFYFLEKIYTDYKDVEGSPYEELIKIYHNRQKIESDITVINIDIRELQEVRNNAQEIANEKVNATLEYWRTLPTYHTALKKYAEALSYTYLQTADNDTEVESLARSFIYVRIAALNDEAFAEELLNRVKEIVPAYIEANMTVPAGYEGTNCQRITRLEEICAQKKYVRTCPCGKKEIKFE